MREADMKHAKAGGASRTWEPMTLTYVGNAGDVLEGGGGKQSPIPEDMGDIFKPPGKG